MAFSTPVMGCQPFMVARLFASKSTYPLVRPLARTSLFGYRGSRYEQSDSLILQAAQPGKGRLKISNVLATVDKTRFSRIRFS